MTLKAFSIPLIAPISVAFCAKITPVCDEK